MGAAATFHSITREIPTKNAQQLIRKISFLGVPLKLIQMVMLFVEVGQIVVLDVQEQAVVAMVEEVTEGERSAPQ